jgi:outer membrane biogenesis lipoprotein LolB
MLQKQVIYTILVSLTVLLTACDSSKQSETDTDAKSSVFKTEQAEVLPYLNIQQQAG